jgi:hypothetical protein
MKRIHQTLLYTVCIAGVSAATAAMAQAPHTVQGGVNNEQKRINAGTSSDQLTHREDANVESHTQSIEAQRNRDLAKNGGHLTSAERTHLNHRLQYNSGRVYRLKHNSEKAHPGT